MFSLDAYDTVSFSVRICPHNLLIVSEASLNWAALSEIILFGLGWAYRGITGGVFLLQNFSVAISVSPHVCFILVLILISVFLR